MYHLGVRLEMKSMAALELQLKNRHYQSFKTTFYDDSGAGRRQIILSIWGKGL